MIPAIIQISVHRYSLLNPYTHQGDYIWNLYNTGGIFAE